MHLVAMDDVSHRVAPPGSGSGRGSVDDPPELVYDRSVWFGELRPQYINAIEYFFSNDKIGKD